MCVAPAPAGARRSDCSRMAPRSWASTPGGRIRTRLPRHTTFPDSGLRRHDETEARRPVTTLKRLPTAARAQRTPIPASGPLLQTRRTGAVRCPVPRLQRHRTSFMSKDTGRAHPITVPPPRGVPGCSPASSRLVCMGLRKCFRTYHQQMIFVRAIRPQGSAPEGEGHHLAANPCTAIICPKKHSRKPFGHEKSEASASL